MKIVILVRILWSAGAQKIAINEAIELKKMGHDVDLIFLRRGKSWKVYEELLSQIDYRVIAEGNSSLFTGLYSFITGLFLPDRKGEGRLDYDLLRKFPKIIKGKKIDKILCHDEWAGIAGYRAKNKLGIPYEVFLHERLGGLDVPVLGRLARRYRIKILKNASRLYAITDKIAKDTYRRFNMNVIANPPGFRNYKTSSVGTRKNQVVSVAMWDSGRDPFFFIELEKYLLDYEILLLGNWRNETYYNEFIRVLPADSKIKLLRNISESEKMNALSESKFFVRFGKLEYGLATAVIESISCGTPVIINDELGTADLIKQYNAGYIVNDIDAKKIADLIQHTDDEKYSQFVTNSIKLRESRTWSDHAKKLI